jgi:hypothetical protein
MRGDGVNVPLKLAGFALVLVATFGAAFGIGRAVGPVGDTGQPAPMPTMSSTTSTTTSTMDAGHGGHS